MKKVTLFTCGFALLALVALSMGWVGEASAAVPLLGLGDPVSFGVHDTLLSGMAVMGLGSIKVLRDKKVALIKEAEDLSAKDAAGTATDEEKARLNAILADDGELADVNAGIARQEKIMDARRSMEAVRSVNDDTEEEAADRRPRGAPATPRDGRNGFQNLADFAIAVRDACQPGGSMADQRLATLRAAPTNYHEGGGTAGEGFELPVAFREQIWEMVFGLDDIIASVDVEPTMARQIDYFADETTPWGATGVQAYWRAEGGQMTASKLATKGRNLALHELYAFVLATEELLEDAARLNDRLTRKSAAAINWKINDALVYGSGAGQPLGWFNAACLVSVAKESGQAADTIVAANVLNMYSRLLVAPGDQPYWLANRDVVPQLATMTIGDQPVWMPPGALISAPGGILLGYPVRFSEHAKTLGDKGDIQLVSPKGYFAARRTQGVNFATSIHLYFDYNIQAFRWTVRVGGQPHLSAAVSPKNGSNTKSHFVVLDERG